jgi:hypothetical protein
MVTTIQIEETLKNKLDKLKLHHRETYNELIMRLIISSSPQKLDRESLLETIEILSDPQTMRDIAKGIEDYNKGRFKTLAQIRKELS